MPMTVKNDISGEKYSKLLALHFIPDNSRYSKYLFRCDCGKELEIMSQSVVSFRTQSCGCHGTELRRKSFTTHGYGKSGLQRTPTYSSWCSMMTRCEWGNHPSYEKYGAAGIKVAKEWHLFENFLRDMGDRPVGTSIDRIDNCKGYFNGNCRWASRRVQALNKRNTPKVNYKGEVVTVFELVQILGLSRSAVKARAFRNGKDYVKAIQSFGIEFVQYIAAERGVNLEV